MDTIPDILIVERDTSALLELEDMMYRLGFNSCSKALPETRIDEIDLADPDLAIIGPGLDPQECLKCIHKLRIYDLSVPIVVYRSDGLCSGEWSTPFEGIHYLSLDADPKTILETIGYAQKQRRDPALLSEFPILIGESEGMRKVREKIGRVCDKDITVLITGESGTGKELIARSIHYHSHRATGPLVKINCGALPDELLESEVFGFQKGAFTGAHKDKPGRLELADGGTLFIDEIGDLSLPLQVKFLQVLEDKAFSRLGGTYEKEVDARVIAATNADLAEKVRKGDFRKDLFFRLDVAHIEARPLRERAEDIPLLIHYFHNKYSYEFKKELFRVPEEVLHLLQAYSWPGNVRELENVIRRAMVLRDWNFIYRELPVDKGEYDEGISLFGDSKSHFVWSEEKVKGFFAASDFSLRTMTKAYVSEVEKEAILRALKETQWNRRKAAGLLKISYKTLLNRILEFDLRP
jgi:two-component system response regulator AtoC